MLAQFLAPGLLQLANSHAVAHGQACRLVGSDGEETEPLCDAIFPEQGQALDVPLPISREDDTDRRHERCEHWLRSSSEGGEWPPRSCLRSVSSSRAIGSGTSRDGPCAG